MESLVAAIMANAEPAQLGSGVDRLEAALAIDTEAASSVHAEVREATELVRRGENCAAVSALLAARSALGAGART